LHDLHLEARYRMMDRYELAARYFFEEYDVTDFANEDVPLLSPVTGSANAVYLGDELQDYRAHRVALLATYRFP
jgi:hypothetical protein